MKKIFAKYNYAFGYIKGYFVLCGLPAIVAIFAALFGMISGKIPGSQALSLLVAGAVVLLIAMLILLATRKKCPLANQAMLPLALNMMLVGLAASFVLAWWMFKWMLKFIFHVQIAMDITENDRYANWYVSVPEGKIYYLLSCCGEYAYLSGADDKDGDPIWVRPYGADEMVCDDSGNLYRPG